MMSEVYTKAFPAPNVDVRAVMRYARMLEFSAEVKELFEDCLPLCLSKTVYRVCYTELPLTFKGDRLFIGDIETSSVDLKKRLAGCINAVVFAATVGMEYDRLISGYGRLNAAKALMFQAIGTERVESLCDAFCEELYREKLSRGESITDRFSPGYGDLPLELQVPIFNILDCEKHIGVLLGASLLMTPSKSVTAIIGVKNQTL